MEKNNLDVAPTEKELDDAGFCKAGASNHSNYGKLIKRINDKLFVMFGGKKCSLCFDYGHVDATIEEIEPTKAAINAEFKHFGQPLPQWEKPKPHQYSYKGLKAEGKIPHDRSGEDHDSIEAFKKLLAICEALNGMFEKDENDIKTRIYWSVGIDCLDAVVVNYNDESPIYLTSEEAFQAFKSAPENVELFKTFLKIK
jgi:hypothetical protein